MRREKESTTAVKLGLGNATRVVFGVYLECLRGQTCENQPIRGRHQRRFSKILELIRIHQRVTYRRGFGSVLADLDGRLHKFLDVRFYCVGGIGRDGTSRAGRKEPK